MALLAPAIVGHAELRSPSAAEQIMSMPALRNRRWTMEELEELIEQREGYTPRYELVDGELLVTPSPSNRHQRIAFELAILLRAYVLEHRLGEVRLGPGAVTLDPDTYFEPDVCVVPGVDGCRPHTSLPVTRLLLAVEVLSPSSARHDRITKRRYYQKHGVPDYWVIDCEACGIEIWHPQDERAMLTDDRLTWRPQGAEAPFQLDVASFFSAVADED